MNQIDLRAFTAALYPFDIPAGAAALIWTLPDKRSTWHTTTATVTADDNHDTYIGAGLAQAPGYGATRRATSAQVIGIPGLWVDLDYLDEVAHKKPNLPTRDQAEAFITSDVTRMRAPSIVVHSGHGFQLWWLFDQPWTWAADDEDTRQRAAALQRSWVYRIRDAARAHGWDVDATIDLARVMRLPGTVNRKGDPPVPVTLRLDDSVARMSVVAWEAAVATLALGAVSPPASRITALTSGTRLETAPSGSSGRLTLNPDAQPPFDKWEALKGADPRVVRTWERKRPSTGPNALADQSASSYDMALASFAALAGWSAQETVDLLIAHRRHHGDDLKLREDYYRRTIDRAQIVGEVERHDSLAETPPLVALSAIWGVTVQSVTKYLGDPPSYTLTLIVDGEDRTITLGGGETILNQAAFRAKVYVTADVVIPTCPSATWTQRVKMLTAALTIKELGPESTPAGVAALWVDEYLDQRRPDDDEWETYLVLGKPYRNPNDPHGVYLTLRDFTFWLRTTRGERVTERELGRWLTMSGAERRTINFIKPDGAHTSRSVWRVAREGTP